MKKKLYVWSWAYDGGVSTNTASTLTDIIKDVTSSFIGSSDVIDVQVSLRNNEIECRYTVDGEEEQSSTFPNMPYAAMEFLQEFCELIQSDDKFDILEFVKALDKLDNVINRNETLTEQSVSYLDGKIEFLAKQAFDNAIEAVDGDFNVHDLIEQLCDNLNYICAEGVLENILELPTGENGSIYADELQTLIDEREATCTD